MTTPRLFAALALVGLLAACTAEETADPQDGATAPDTTASPAPVDASAPPTPVDAAPPATPGSKPITEVTAFIAGGNEPFWSVEVDGDALIYSTPEQMPGLVLQATREARDGNVVYRGEHDGREFELALRDQPCQDSMSGWRHDFTARFDWGATTMTGCARRTGDPVGEAPDAAG